MRRKHKELESLEMRLAALQHLSPAEMKAWIDEIIARNKRHKADVWRATRALRPSHVDMLKLY